MRNNANQWIMIPFYSPPSRLFSKNRPQNAHAAKIEIRSTGPTETRIKETPFFLQPKGMPSVCKKRAEKCHDDKTGKSFAHMPFKKHHPAMQTQPNPNPIKVFFPLLLILSFPFPLW